MDEHWQDVAAEAAIPLGGMQAAVVGGRRILVCRLREGLFAVDAACTHAAASLEEGWLRGHRLTCPLHGAAFDVRDGRALGPPAFHWLPTHRVRVDGGRVLVALGRPGIP